MEGLTDIDAAAAEHGFLLRFLADREGGRELDLEGYQNLFPGHEETIARKYAELHGPDEPAAVRSGGPAGERLGRFCILRELGRGGQATVYLADDPRLRRRVALKVLPPRFGLGTEERLRRFRREAEAASRLEHPNLCTVYETGEADDVAYIAMCYVEGETLREKIERAKRAAHPTSGPVALTPGKGPGDPSSSTASRSAAVVRLFEDLARALHYVHEHGLVHRDVKPGNVMIANDGTPVILDFGLAHDEREVQATLTLTGDVLGTPAYMSPEQLQPAGGRLDRRTDVYSLGATLHECLTLRPPFEAPTREALYQKILTADRSSASRPWRQIPRDLQVVVDTALERDRARRYGTALDLAEDLRRIRELRPIQARPPGPLRRVQRWCRRNPAAAVALVLLVGGLSISGWQTQRERRILRHTRALGLARSAAEVVETDPMLGLLLAREAVKLEEQSETVSQLHAALARVHERARLVGHSGPIYSLAFWGLEFSPDGRWIATASEDGTARVWNLEGKEICPPLAHGGRVTSARFTHDSQRIVTTCEDGRARVWDLEGRELGELDHGAFLFTASLAHEHDWVVLAGLGLDEERRPVGLATVWNLDTLEEIARLGGHEAWVTMAAFSPQDERILTADGYEDEVPRSEHFTARLWDLEGNEVCPPLEGHADSHVAAAFSADGRILTASKDGQVYVWDGDGRRLFGFPHGGRLRSAAFAPDGSILTAGKGDATVRLWGPDGEPGWQNRDQTDTVVMATFSPDGERIVTAGTDMTARVLDASSGEELAVLRGHRRSVTRAVLHPDGNLVATVSLDGTARLWEVSRPELPILRGGDDSVTCVAISQDGERVLTGSETGAVRLWAASGELLHSLPEPCGGKVPSAVLSPLDDELILVASRDGFVRLWNVTAKEVRRIAWHEDLVCAAFDGERVLTAHQDGVARLCDLSGEPIREFPTPTPWVESAEFSPDGRFVVAASRNGAVRIWDCRLEEPLAVLSHDQAVSAATFSPDGGLVLTGSADGMARLWDWRRGETIQVFRGHQAGLVSCAFSPDARRVVTASEDGTVRIWNLENGTELARLVHSSTPMAAVFSFPDGRWVLTAHADGTVRYWLPNTEDALELAGRLAFRDFAEAERELYRDLLEPSRR